MKALLLFIFFFFTFSQFTIPLLPPADFSGPGQIYHPQTGKCLSHALAVEDVPGTPILTVSLQPCEGELDGANVADGAQKPYRRTIWKFKKFAKAPVDILNPELITDNGPIKAYIVPFSDKYGPTTGTFVLGVTNDALSMVSVTDEATISAVWEVNYKKTDKTFLGSYFSFNPFFYLKISKGLKITTAASLTTAVEDAAVTVDGEKTAKTQVSFKYDATKTPPIISLPLEVPPTAVPFSSQFVFRKVGFSSKDGAALQNTFVFNADVHATQLPDDERISFVLSLDPAINDAKKKGIHNNGFFSLQAPATANNISALCTTKYNNTYGLTWDFFESYDFAKKQLNNLLLPPLDENAPSGAIRIIASPLQLVSCGFLKTDGTDGIWQLDGKIGYVDTNTRSGFYWNVVINVNEHLSAINTYIDNPDSHYWYYDQSQTVNAPNFGRIIVHHIDATDLKPLANGAAVSTTAPAKVPFVPLEDNQQIMVRDYLLYQLVLQNSTTDSYTISNVHAYIFQRKLNPNSGAVEDAGAVELTVKEVGKAANNYNFTLPLEKVPTGDYKLLLQYSIDAAKSRRVLAEEDRRVIKTEVGSTVMGVKIVNDALAGEWMRFLGMIAAILALVFMV